ncbi:MAG: 16S rRNA processing protein RimM [Betaproteobacteria bacterium RIFCSPLOWO2_12_FULL_67_28]|nr:MAG: 16S rRNA processing protein RimM [Betaproteobacteria bacterium RIFCSPLOWO2_12_FULL_67_28]
MIELGRVAGSYGVCGWLAVRGECGVLSASRTWWVDGAARSVERCRMHSGRLLAKLEGIESREQAKALKGKPVSVPRSALPAPAHGMYYWDDLVGLEVVNAQGLLLGVVRGLFSNGAHDVMELSGDKRERMLPFVPAVVRHVDLEGRRIEVDWGADW